MLWIAASLFFCWLIYRELTSHMPIFKGYLIALCILALACAWPPFHYWRFKQKLNEIARQLSDNPAATVHCNTLWDTLFDEQLNQAGHCDPRTGKIMIQYPHCYTLMNYVAYPERASKEEIISLHVLTHESMHAGGEYNEAKTECKAIQRNYRTAKLLGIPEDIAKQNALNYYTLYYKTRSDSYFSKECAPGKALDEQLSDFTW